MDPGVRASVAGVAGVAGGARRRRAIWLTRLFDSSVVWREPVAVVRGSS